MRKIFISYRRSEAEYAAGALGRDLRRHFGDEQVFRDKEDIGGGVAWKDELLREIDQDCALLVLIGRDWADIKDRQGRRRLDMADDGLRLEIADGIKDGAAIIPVLLENAQMPPEGALPPEIRRLCEFNALTLRDGDWPYDIGKIFRTLERVGFRPAGSSQPAPAPIPPPVPPPVVRKKTISTKAIVGGIAVLLGFAAVGSIVAVLGILGSMGESGTRQLQGSQPAAQTDSASTTPPGGSTGTAPDAVAPELRASAKSGLASLDLLRGHALLKYDPELWKPMRDTAPEPGNFQYSHKNGEVFFKVITERIPIGLEKLAEIGFTNAQEGDPNAKITRVGSRRVNGLRMLTREFEVTVSEIKWTFYVHYYSDESCAVQLVGWTGRALIDEHRATIEEFVSGFTVADKAR